MGGFKGWCRGDDTRATTANSDSQTLATHPPNHAQHPPHTHTHLSNHINSGGAFSVAVRELVSHYMALERFYLEATAAMALRIDARAPGALTGSAVDDVFYLLKRCGGRALATGSVQCAAALLGEANDLLAGPYRAALQARLAAGGPARLAAAAPPPLGAAGASALVALEPDAAALAAAEEHCAAINGADVSADYAAKLRAELEALAERVFAGAGERERARSVLSDLGKTGGDFRALAGRALEAAADALLPRLRPALDEAAAADYCIDGTAGGGGDADDADDAAGGGGWALKLLAALDLQLRWLRPRLTPAAWEALFHALLDRALARLEVALGRKRFTQLGGLRLDRDVRRLAAAAGEMTARTVRDKFARLTQVRACCVLRVWVGGFALVEACAQPIVPQLVVLALLPLASTPCQHPPTPPQ